jgi:hypothetical protein
MRCHTERYNKKGRRKRHAGDCGHARCGICHSYKFPKREKTRRELMADSPKLGDYV